MTDDSRWPGASPAASARLDLTDPARAPHVRAFLRRLAHPGCQTEVPPSVRRGYLNIEPPAGTGEERLAALTVRTGRLQFQKDSWDAAATTGHGARFAHPDAGNKAAISHRTEDDVAAAVAVATAILAGRTHA